MHLPKASKADYQRLITTLNKVKEIKEMDSKMTPSIQKQLNEANAIFEEGNHVITQLKTLNPLQFLQHQSHCGMCFRVQIRNGDMKTLEEFQDWTHHSREVQCEKFGHSKWLMENLYVLN